MSFSFQREQEFLADVNKAQESLRALEVAMKKVRLTLASEEDIADFVEFLHSQLAGLEEHCHKNLKG